MNLSGLFERTHALVLAGSLAILIFVFSIGGSIAGSYALTLGAIHHNQVQQAQAAAQRQALAIQVEIKGAKASCIALTALDNASHGIKFPAPGKAHPSELALTRLFAGIHAVVVASHCHDLLTGNYHIADGQILPGRK